MRELEIEALPQDLPPSIAVDISGLDKLEARLLIKDLKLPKGVKVHMEMDDIVALVETPRSEAELEELAKTETVAEVAEVKTEQEVKAEEKAKKAVEADTAEPKKTDAKKAEPKK